MRIIRVFLFISFAFFSCKPASDKDADLSAVIDSQEFRKAKKIIEKIDYLPYQYANDGCYARSQYMSMELAAQKIPSSSQVISVCVIGKDNDSNMLTLANGVQWYYHVAPLVVVKGQDYIFDPSTSRQPLKREKWQRIVNHTRVPHYFEVFSPNESNLYGEEDKCGQDLGKEKIIRSFEEMKPFSRVNLGGYCALMWSFIERTPKISTANKTKMKKKLLERTEYLINELEILGKLQKLESYESFSIAEVLSECQKGVPEK